MAQVVEGDAAWQDLLLNLEMIDQRNRNVIADEFVTHQISCLLGRRTGETEEICHPILGNRRKTPRLIAAIIADADGSGTANAIGTQQVELHVAEIDRKVSALRQRAHRHDAKFVHPGVSDACASFEAGLDRFGSGGGDRGQCQKNAECRAKQGYHIYNNRDPALA